MPQPTQTTPRRSGPRRVGHKGAAHTEPGNTLASFDAALRHGVDMIELDVPGALPCCLRVLIHVDRDESPRHVYLREAATLRPDMAGER